MLSTLYWFKNNKYYITITDKPSSTYDNLSLINNNYLVCLPVYALSVYMPTFLHACVLASVFYVLIIQFKTIHIYCFF